MTNDIHPAASPASRGGGRTVHPDDTGRFMESLDTEDHHD